MGSIGLFAGAAYFAQTVWIKGIILSGVDVKSGNKRVSGRGGAEFCRALHGKIKRKRLLTLLFPDLSGYSVLYAGQPNSKDYGL